MAPLWIVAGPGIHEIWPSKKYATTLFHSGHFQESRTSLSLFSTVIPLLFPFQGWALFRTEKTINKVTFSQKLSPNSGRSIRECSWKSWGSRSHRPKSSRQKLSPPSISQTACYCAVCTYNGRDVNVIFRQSLFSQNTEPCPTPYMRWYQPPKSLILLSNNYFDLHF